MLPKEESRLRWILKAGIFLLVLVMGTPSLAASQDSWAWRLETERLTQEALTIKAQTQGQLYRIQKGDTLWGLAQQLNVDTEVLAAMNYLSRGDKLYPGQQIRLPIEPDKTYQVRAGDTLWDIARNYEVSVNLLMTANRITRPETLQIGQMITIPGSPMALAVQSRRDDNPAAGVLVSRGRTGQFNWPLRGRITSPYGKRKQGFHHGMDIGGQTGEPIRAAQAGTIRFAGFKNNIYGNAVEIRHDNGLVTVYAHNSKNLVKTGQRVKTGEVIAQVGRTGRATGPHLHFEVRVNDKAVDPMPYLK